MAINIRKMVQWAVDPWQFFAYLSAISVLASAKKEQIKNIQKERTKVNDTFYLNSKYEDIK